MFSTNISATVEREKGSREAEGTANPGWVGEAAAILGGRCGLRRWLMDRGRWIRPNSNFRDVAVADKREDVRLQKRPKYIINDSSRSRQPIPLSLFISIAMVCENCVQESD